MLNNKRFELVLPGDLYNSVAKRAEIEGVSVAHVIRSLLNQWDNGLIVTENQSRPVKYKEGNQREFFCYHDADELYKFSMIASGISMSRIRLMQEFITQVVTGVIDVGKMVYGCNR